jgi:hypothetical protein
MEAAAIEALHESDPDLFMAQLEVFMSAGNFSRHLEEP